MKNSPAKIQAVLALGLAVLIWAGWSVFGTPLKVRWLVARGAPPAGPEAAEAVVKEIRVIGLPAKGALLSAFRGGGSRARKSWVASLLLRAPFFARAEVEAALGSGDTATARAAAFALMGGAEETESFEVRAARLQPGGEVETPRAPLETWDPEPAIPVLLEWVADRGDLEARYAARLLGTIPPGDERVKEALLKVVEEVPEIIGPGAAGDMQLRKFVVVDALQGLLARAVHDESVVARVSKVVSWIDEEGLSDAGWDLQAYALRLVEVARGRGVDPGLLVRLSRSPNPVLRQRLANTLETIPGAGARGILEYLAFDEAATVRRSAMLTLKKRKDPELLDLLPVLLEDSYIFVRSDALRAVGEMRGVEPARCRALLPLLVSCIEEPWQGEDAAPGTPQASFQEGGEVEVVEAAALSLWQIGNEAHGFLERDGKGVETNAIFDWKKRPEIARRIVEDEALRREVVDAWRKSVEPRPAGERVPALVRRLLEDRDPANVVRAMRELVRLTGEDATFPKESLVREGDDVEARNAVREWWDEGGREKARAHWGSRLEEE